VVLGDLESWLIGGSRAVVSDHSGAGFLLR
jgi:hemin uptake protein HemP